MSRLAAFCRKSGADQRLLVRAAALHAIAAIALRVLPFGRARRLLRAVATLGPRPCIVAGLDARVVRAVRTVSSLLPAANCLTEALVAHCLLARYRCDTTLCFGLSGERPADRPFDAHAWLERGGAGLVGARAIAYEPLRHPSRCASSPGPR